MGIESDQLVYDYLSKVGDLAQRQSLTSGDRMRLVSRLRAEIERRRAAEGADTPAAVQRILDGLGTPSEAVADGGAAAGAFDAGRVPEQRRGGAAAARPAAGGASPPHMAPEEELMPAAGGAPDWWRMAPGPMGGGDAVHGFVGGIEIPDMLRPPRASGEVERTTVLPGEVVEAAADDGGAEGGGGRRRFGLLRPPRPIVAEERPAAIPMSPLLVLVAALLVAGAVLGNWIVLAGGWALAYVTRKLTQTESKWAVMGVPGLAVAGGVVWLWGRVDGRWGDPIPQGELGAAMAGALPVVIRVAAVGSALYVLWRARRPG